MIYILFLLVLLAFLICLSIFYIYNVFAAFKGSPYVPTARKQLDLIFKEIQLKKGQTLIDLGCGDGRVVEYAALKYRIFALGIDVNAFLILWARIRSRLKGIKVRYKVEDIFLTDISKADIIFVFLMPKVLERLILRFKTLKKGTQIISHGFKLPQMEEFLLKTLYQKPFPTYFYRLDNRQSVR